MVDEISNEEVNYLVLRYLQESGLSFTSPSLLFRVAVCVIVLFHRILMSPFFCCCCLNMQVFHIARSCLHTKAV